MNKTFKTICLFLALGTSSAFADNLNKCSFYSETFNKIDFKKISPEDETNFTEILSSLKYKGYSLTNDKSKASFSLVFDEKSKTTSKYLGLSNDTTYEVSAHFKDRNNFSLVSGAKIFSSVLTEAQKLSVDTLPECADREERDHEGFPISDNAKQCLNTLENDHTDDCSNSVLAHAGLTKALAIGMAEKNKTRLTLAGAKIIFNKVNENSNGYYLVQPLLDHFGNVSYSVTTYAVLKGRQLRRHCKVEPVLASVKRLNKDQMLTWLNKKQVDCL